MLTLEEAIRIAERQNPEILAARHQMEIAGAGITQARSGFFPNLYLSERFNRTTNPMWAFGTRLNQQVIREEDFNPDRLNNPDPITNFTTAVSMSWEIYNGGKTRDALHQAYGAFRMSSLDLRQIRQQIIARTAKGYSDLILARENSATIRRVLNTAQAHLAMVESKYSAGLIVKSDLLRAQVRVSEIELELLSAESALSTAVAALNTAMGYAEHRSLIPVTGFNTEIRIDGPVESWIQTASSGHPDLERIKEQELIGEKEIRKAGSGHWPNLELVGSYEMDSEDFRDSADSYTIGAVMRLNLFSGFRVSSGIASAKASLKRFQELKHALNLKIALETRQAFHQTQSAGKRIQVAEKAQEQAREALRIMRNRYENQLVPLVSLLDAETAYQQAMINRTRALYDYQNARIHLALATGTLDVDFR
jgi:outer membrane protein TolC